MKSVMTKDFSRVAQTEINRSTFNRGRGHKTAFDAGYLVPIECQEVVPGDTVDFRLQALARLAPVVTPVMDNVFLDAHAFFVPSRLVWNNFTKMMGERVNPNDSIDYLVPMFNLTNDAKFGIGSLADYLGLPVNQMTADGGSVPCSILPFRCYQKIWDDWYRDENLQDSIIQNSSELGDTITDDKWFTLRKRGKRHDYFTSGLPWPQKGEGVNLPLGDYSPVVTRAQQADLRVGNALRWTDASTGAEFIPDSGSTGCNLVINSNGQTKVSPESNYPVGTEYLKPNNLWADLTNATAATINSLRMAFQLQRMMESDARGGTRYVEIIRNHFKTICPDARLQRSEYLAGSSVQIQFSPIAQTSGTMEGGTPQGNLVATAHCYSDGDLRFTKSFSEHGYLFVLVSVRCDLNYQQGVDRMWTRKGRYDFYWPTLAHLGEQAILNKEIYAQGSNVKDASGNVVDDKVFAYQERYAEMRYNPSRITGKMRSGVSGSLDVWHLAQDFETLPTLSAEFIEEDPPLDRVLAVTEGEPQIIFDSYLHQTWTRPLPVYSIPGLIDHL